MASMTLRALCISPNNWVEIVTRCEAAGVDAFEINFSCPHGMPERKMGAAMGQDCDVLTEVCGWQGLTLVHFLAQPEPFVLTATI